MNADGTNQTRLTNNSASDTYPAFSPDSGQIAFDSNRDGNDEIYVMKADGSGPDAADQRRGARQLSGLEIHPGTVASTFRQPALIPQIRKSDDVSSSSRQGTVERSAGILTIVGVAPVTRPVGNGRSA